MQGVKKVGVPEGVVGGASKSAFQEVQMEVAGSSASSGGDKAGSGDKVSPHQGNGLEPAEQGQASREEISKKLRNALFAEGRGSEGMGPPRR